MSQTLHHWRCFWRWPIGHKWEQVSDAGVTYLRCANCGMSQGGRGTPTWSDTPHERYRTGGESVSFANRFVKPSASSPPPPFRKLATSQHGYVQPSVYRRRRADVRSNWTPGLWTRSVRIRDGRQKSGSRSAPVTRRPTCYHEAIWASREMCREPAPDATSGYGTTENDIIYGSHGVE
jgi:hypothetical protein